MGGLKKIAVFLAVLMSALPAFAAVLPPPALSVIQRGNDAEMLFLWKAPVGFSEKIENNVYTLTFDANAAAPVGQLRQILTALPERWRKVSTGQSGGRLTLSVVLPKGGNAVARKDGKSVFVLLSNKVQKAVIPAKPVAPAVVVDKEKKAAPVAEKKAVNPPGNVEVIDDVDEKIAVDTTEKPSKKPEAGIAINLAVPASFQDGQANELTLNSPSEYVQSPDVSGYRTVSLSFPWSRMTAAAAFRRDGYLWIVFDRKGEFKFDLELELYKDIIHEMIQIPHSQATIFRLVTEKGYNPSLRREGLLWVVDLMYRPIRPRQPVDLVLQRKTPFGPRIFAPLDEASQVLPLIDPEVGDLMYIIPIFALGKGVPVQRSFVDADFLQTAQGIVIIPNIEELNVYSSTSGVEVRGPKGGMRFSSEDILAFLAKSKVSTDPLSQILDVGAWAPNDPAEYLSVLKNLQDNVLTADKEHRDLQRLVLARYYFANGMYPESISIVRTIAADNPKMAETPALTALHGANNFMLKRYDEAMKDFSSPLLKNNNAVDYWRAATLAATSRNPENYLPTMKDNMAILQAYTYPVKTELALAGLHAAVAAGDEFSIQNFMEAAYNPLNSLAENSEVEFYHALWQEATGGYSAARREMKRLSEGRDFYFRAMAGLESVRMDSHANALTPEERIEKLEHLSYAWRGGEFEYNLMTMLVNAYQEQKDYSQVLHMLKEMRNRFDNPAERQKIQKLMEGIFQKIYLGDEGNELSPVKAVALYDEFNELTPSGEKGARIVRRLADRLVSIDLLDRAADLLDEQLNHSIGNKERGLVSTRLALVRLLNKEPEKALNALKISEKSAFSDKITRQRRYIQAKALADMKQTEQAADLLEEDDSEEAKMLRAEIYWQAQMWDKAADALKVLIKKPEAKTPLTQQEAQRVLDWAAALRLAGRSKVVMRLRENFMPYMEKTNLVQAFDFITKTPQQGLLDYHQVAKEVESAESFHSFAKEYTDRIKTQGLSETVQ